MPQRKFGTDVKFRPATCLHSLPFRSLIKSHSPFPNQGMYWAPQGIPHPRVGGACIDVGIAAWPTGDTCTANPGMGDSLWGPIHSLIWGRGMGFDDEGS